MKKFKIFSVGFDPEFSDRLFAGISEQTNISFIHGVVGNSARLGKIRNKYQKTKFLALSKLENAQLPKIDYELLESLESVGIPTIRSMIQGDRVLREIPADEALAYATLIASSLKMAFIEENPNTILGSFDNLHSSMSLAVARSLGIPWVALSFTVIPDNLTAFCSGMSPNQIVPLHRIVNQKLKDEANCIIDKIKLRQQAIPAFRPQYSILARIWGMAKHAQNLSDRIVNRLELGIDKYTFESPWVRAKDIGRRFVNRLLLPVRNMIKIPPENRFIYYPMHMQPESSIDAWAPFYQNQLGFVMQLALAIPADTTFVIKLHFSDPDNYSRQQLRQLMSLPGLRIAHPNAPGSDFIENAALVVGIQGTSCLEAALLGKPVLIFGDSPYVNFPRSERAKRPDELYEQIRRMLKEPPPSDDEIVEAYATYLARYMPGRTNDWSRPITSDELERYAACFDALRSYLSISENQANWYVTPLFSRS